MGDRHPESPKYVHGTSRAEQTRLAALNRMINPEFIDFLDVQPNTRVLEVGSGLGLLAAEVASRYESTEFIALEVSREQIEAGAKSPRVEQIHGDAHKLELADSSFDLVYARFVLEHVSDPAQVLSEMHRVTKEGGRVALCENDVSLVRVDPPCPAFERAWKALATYQSDIGGDALIGRSLFRLLRQAGFTEIDLSVQPEVHAFGTEYFELWIENLIDIVEGAAAGFLERGLCCSEEISDAVRELRQLITCNDASAHFMWNRALARR